MPPPPCPPPCHRREDLARNEGFEQREDFFFPGESSPFPSHCPQSWELHPPGASPAPRDGSSVPPAHGTRVTGTGSVPQLTQADFFPLLPLLHIPASRRIPEPTWLPSQQPSARRRDLGTPEEVTPLGTRRGHPSAPHGGTAVSPRHGEQQRFAEHSAASPRRGGARVPWGGSRR